MGKFNFLLKQIDGSDAEFVQDNESKSRKGVLRGLHMQFNHTQAKLVRVINGEVWDVAVDVRKKSPTFGQWHGVLLSDENKKQQFFITGGIFAVFVVLYETATLYTNVRTSAEPTDEYSMAWDDKDIGVEWPTTEVQFLKRTRKIIA